MISEQIMQGVERAPQRSLLYAAGFTEDEIKKPLIGVVSAQSEIIPGHMHLSKIAEAVKAGIYAAGGAAAFFAFQQTGIIQLSGFVGTDCFKHLRKAGLFALDTSRQHRPAGADDGRNVQPQCCHDHAGYDLVAVGNQH